MTDAKLEQWRKDGLYLPGIMRDFHDQKDLFKTIHDRVNVEGHEYAGKVGWFAGQCYVIDIFLWFMARHGYVLRRSTARLNFDNLNAVIKACGDKRLEDFASILDVIAPSQQIATRDKP